MREREKKLYYRIRPGVFWGMIGSMILLILGFAFKDILYEEWVQSKGVEKIAFAGINSKLERDEECYFCGENNYNLTREYQNAEKIGVISLNDWYVLDFPVSSSSETESEEHSDSCLLLGKTEEMRYSVRSSFSGAKTSVEIMFPDKCKLKMEPVREHLCQSCLDKVSASLEFQKWKNENKEAIPICLVDFKTLDIYSLQEWSKSCKIRNCLVEMNREGNKTMINLYFLNTEDPCMCEE